MFFSATTILSFSSIVVASPLVTRNPSALHALSKSTATSVDNGADLTAYPAGYKRDDEDRQYGPSQFCQGLSPGGGETCIDIPAGCYIIIPEDNTVPTPICGDQ